MSYRRQDPERQTAESLDQAFRQAAEGLDLKLEPAPAGDAYCIGIAFVCVPFVAYDVVDSPPPVGHDDDAKIGHLIRGVEALAPLELQHRWRHYFLDPHIASTLEGIVRVDQEAIDQWLASPRYQDYMAEYPPQNPRDVKVHNLQIAYIGRERASATYRVVEKHANGKVTGGNVTAILALLEHHGWRIVVVTKGGREELLENA
jgi:hypothetical protein